VTDESDISQEARALSQRGASQGGRERAARLSPELRREIARNAAQVRWGLSVRPAAYVGNMEVGNGTIACAVLDDGTRVINQGTMLTAFSRASRAKGGDAGPVLFATNLHPFVSPELEDKLKNPITYSPPTGGRALGYPAEVLPAVCEVYLDAEEHGRILKSQEKPLAAAKILMRGLARVGIVALIDEATGYQEVRARDELQRILEAYVQAELRPWIKTFPDDFFREIYRLQGWDYKPGTSKRTPYVGKLINKYVYEQLPPHILDELRRLNPRNASGNRSHKHFQFLTADTGNPHLNQQISTVTTLLRVARNKHDFEDIFERAFPPPQQRLPLVIENIVELDSKSEG
jgi:hypothetical protein